MPHLAYVLNAFANEGLAIQKADRSVQLVLSGPEVPGAQSSALSTLINRTFTSRDPRSWSCPTAELFSGSPHFVNLQRQFCIWLALA